MSKWTRWLILLFILLVLIILIAEAPTKTKGKTVGKTIHKKVAKAGKKVTKGAKKCKTGKKRKGKKSGGGLYSFGSKSSMFVLKNAADHKKFSEYLNSKRSKLALGKYKKYVKTPAGMKKTAMSATLNAKALKYLKDGRGKHIYIIRFSKKKSGYVLAKDAMTEYFSLVVKSGISCKKKRCDTKRYRRQFLPFQLLYSDATTIGCAFQYGMVSKGKGKSFGVRMLCISGTKMTDSLYAVGKTCSGCLMTCSKKDGLCKGGKSGGGSTSRKSSTKRKGHKSKQANAVPDDSGSSIRSQSSGGNTSPQKLSLGANCESSNFSGDHNSTGSKDGDIIAEYINSLRAKVATGTGWKFSGNTKTPVDIFKVLWKDSLGAEAEKVTADASHTGSVVDVLSFYVKDDSDKMVVMRAALVAYMNKMQRHISCKVDTCYCKSMSVLMEVLKSDVTYIGCQIRYSKEGGTAPKLSVKAVVHCVTEPPLDRSSGGKIEMFKQADHGCADPDPAQRTPCSDATHNQCEKASNMCASQEYTTSHPITNP